MGIVDLESHRRHRLTISHIDDYSYQAGQPVSLKTDMDPEEMAQILAPLIIQQHNCRPRDQSFLVFLPGKKEVHVLADHLCNKPNLTVQRIYGGQALGAQEGMLHRVGRGSNRLVILATDVVESSVTIPSVDLVFDTCQQRRRRWNPQHRESPLTRQLVSKDEALQRAGRTARVRPGEVLRLVSRQEFDLLQQHAEPEVRHQPLDSLVVTVFGFRGISMSPQEFLHSLPEAPNQIRLDCAVARLEELGALAMEGGSLRPTPLGRLLEQLPLDPEAGQLVVNGLRYNALEECCILAAIVQLGSPLETPPVDDSSWTIQMALDFWQVQQVCCGGAPPSDLLAAAGAVRAWQNQLQSRGEDWAAEMGPEWCAAHFLCLERLQAIDEVAGQVHEVLEKLGYNAGRGLHAREGRLRAWKRRRYSRVNKGGNPEHSRINGGDPARTFRTLLGYGDAIQERLLQWCIAASYVHGAISLRGSSCTEEVRFVPRQGQRLQVEGFLRSHGFQVTSSRSERSNEVIVTFASKEEACRALQVAALGTNGSFPFKRAEANSWGRQRRLQVQLRGSAPGNCTLVAQSMSEPQVQDGAEVITACALPVKTSKGFFYLCSKNTVVPCGLLPVAIMATYFKQELAQGSSPGRFILKARFLSKWEHFDLRVADASAFADISIIRDNMDKEFAPGVAAGARPRIVNERSDAVLRLMDRLCTGGPPLQTIAPQSSFGLLRNALAPLDLSGIFEGF
ncbi:unnamed protein product [Polarella glacialis]|uniref:Helicase C-terminal domain-containing protein n=1 Tax=Polarella glacialis TaxID=89957 RepID=A0A813DQI5_POLGL|nr:unnamed protein product [Polarella glacialis]